MLNIFKKPSAALKSQTDHDWLIALADAAGPSEIRTTLEKAGYVLSHDRRVIQKPGRCESCRDHHVLQIGRKSGHWLCTTCWTQDACAT